ncbi:MAG: CPBP family intramembrane metalloprotease [Cyclobacteriaceae bacterium]|nr:CPBP family intramembrane metalloprotease [Cyclobacteriaceae bacterium]
MQKVYHYLINYQKEHFDLKLYVSVFLVIIFGLWFNYSLDFENSYIDTIKSLPLKWLSFLAFQGVPYLAVAFLLSYFGKVKKWYLDYRFWLFFLLGFSIQAIDRSFYFGNFLYPYFDPVPARFLARIINWQYTLLQFIVPFVLIYYFFEKDRDSNVYGLAMRRFDARPYLYLLLIACVFIVIGSFFNDIQAYYPHYHVRDGERFAAYFHLPNWLSVVLFEGSYGANFISVELFFRGFLLYSMTRFFGSYAVLPMVVSYCFLHFGKPLTESISSVFGGYVLGIVSLYNKNIWGGVMIHVGIAWLMELLGYLHKL